MSHIYFTIIASWFILSSYLKHIMYTLQDSYMSEFLPRLSSKMTELFPGSEHLDLLPFLLNSRAVSAYDAVMLLVNSVTSSFKKSEDPLNPCLLVSSNHVGHAALEESLNTVHHI